MTHIEREKLTVRSMIELYCRRRHRSGTVPCDECASLIEYCEARLDRCRFGERKPTCRNCQIHCYAPARREEIRAVMRWAGPRMIFYRPFDFLRHLIH